MVRRDRQAVVLKILAVAESPLGDSAPAEKVDEDFGDSHEAVSQASSRSGSSKSASAIVRTTLCAKGTTGPSATGQ